MARELALGDVIDGAWRAERLLGGGGMGSVYACRNQLSGALAAVKVMHGHVARDEALRARFIAEGRALGRVQHPGVVRAFGDGMFGDAPFLLMELAQGRTLRELAAARGGVLALTELGPIVDQLLEALLAVHQAGVVHRDVKPDNVIVTETGAVKLVDFGIARLDDGQGVTTTGGFVGTPAFMAPEQLLGKSGRVDARTDLFAVGALIWRLLTGKNVHDDCTGTELLIAMGTRQAPSLATVAPSLPVAVVRVVDQALAFEASRRFVDAGAMRAAWRAALGGGGHAGARTVAPTVGVHVRAQPTRRWLVPTLLGAAAVLALGAGSALLLSRSSSDRAASSESEETEEAAPRKKSKKKARKAASVESSAPTTAAVPVRPAARGICGMDIAALQLSLRKTAGEDPLLLTLEVNEFSNAFGLITDSMLEIYNAIPPSSPFILTHSSSREGRVPSTAFRLSALARLLEPAAFKKLCTDAEARFAQKWGIAGATTNLSVIAGRPVLFSVHDHPRSEMYCYDAATLSNIACD